ncbi:nuclear transport factor 2 family protein [Pseudomonadales bacterium]|nr:nuclear transport factor 2 family protein [Pseudomonadales bacterium]
MKKITYLLIALVIVTGLGCASQSEKSNSAYPDAYREALSDFPGDRTVEEETINEFTQFLMSLGQPGAAATARKLYAEELHFSDALMHTRDREKVVTHFDGLGKAGTTVNVEMHQTLVSGADVYLVWSMRATFKPIIRTVESDTLGITHLRFNEQGQVVLHQDFWDSGLGFYSHVPFLGGVVRAVNKRFQAE